MLAVEQLKKEHEAILLLLDILGVVCKVIEAGEKVSQKDLEDILEFISVFADKCHHAKEEDLLFPAMEESGIPRDGGPIEAMLQEHDLGRSFVKGMREAKTQQEFAVAARNYISLLTQHIEKENDILYAIANVHIPEEKQEELVNLFEKLEEEKIGIGKHEEFHKLLKKLEKIYLAD